MERETGPVGTSLPPDERAAHREVIVASSSRMSSSGTTTSRSSSFREPASTSSIAAPVARDEASDLHERALRRGEPDALDRPLDEPLETLERQCQVGAPLRARDGMHLVDDHRLDSGEHLARLGREQQEERLRAS